MKEKFESPKMEYIKFSHKNVVTTSGGGVDETTTKRNDGPIELPDLEV